ncbi:MAG TPA: MFS transporter [Vicinamibacterales bacterium]|nr:MFS transporter [Vicinamibacterales bacterium]
MSDTSLHTAPAQAAKAGHYRWVVCALIFLATTINYVDRQVIGILKNTLEQEFGWSEIDYSNIVVAFQTAYAIGLLLAGRLIDRLGTKRGYALAIVIWSVAAIAHAEATLFGPWVAWLFGLAGFAVLPSVAGFIAARFALGLGEAGNFPAAIKAVAEWFPKRERALATGIFNSGTNVGALVTPIVVPIITLTWGWYWAFVITGALGFVWLIWWWIAYDAPDRHPRVKPAELALIQSDPAEPVTHIPWARLFPHRQAWAFAIGKFMTDPIWWVYLFWIPDFLNRNHGLDLSGIGPPIVVIYLVADVGSIGGGWLSSTLLKRGWTVNRARKTAMFVCAAAVVPIVFAANTTSLWLAVALISLAAAAHQGWSANIFTLVSDTFPRRAVGSVVGFGGMAGAIGGMLISTVTGFLLETTGSYLPVFIIASSAYLAALLIIHLLMPRIEPVNID